MRSSPPVTELPADIRIATQTVRAGDATFTITLPTSAEDLIDEAEFAVDERLPYWAELWPSGRVLADRLAAMDLTGLRVVELGAGVGLPAVVAAVGGAHVLATDWYEPALRFAAHNAAAAGVVVHTALVDWRDPPAHLVEAPPFDLVLAADVLYEPRNAAPLAALVARITSPHGTVLIADPRRPDATAFLDGIQGAGWHLVTEQVEFTGRRDETGSRINLHTLRPPRA